MAPNITSTQDFVVFQRIFCALNFVDGIILCCYPIFNINILYVYYVQSTIYIHFIINNFESVLYIYLRIYLSPIIINFQKSYTSMYDDF